MGRITKAGTIMISTQSPRSRATWLGNRISHHERYEEVLTLSYFIALPVAAVGKTYSLNTEIHMI